MSRKNPCAPRRIKHYYYTHTGWDIVDDGRRLWQFNPERGIWFIIDGARE